MSILPSETVAKVGDYVTFTIVAKNYGPGSAELFVNTMEASEGLVSGGLMPGDPSSTNCGVVNGPAPQPGSHGNDGSWCEDGLTQPGDTVTDTVIMQIAPTSTGRASATACASSPDDPVGYVDPTNGCKTATVQVSGITCSTGLPGGTQTFGSATYNLEGEDTFTRNAPLGSFAQGSAADANALPVVYTGDHGMGWTEYSDGWSANGVTDAYSPSTVQSVHDGVLDFYLHDNSSGQPVGASISPLPGGNRYQTYGAWSFCELVAPTDHSNLADFHQAPLLWPYSDTDASAAESDFPEGDLGATAPVDPSNQFSAYAHYAGPGPGVQDQFHFAAMDPSFSPYQWHVYTQVWGPGYRSYYVDGQLVGTSTTTVYGQEERWQLQVQPANPADPSYSPFGSGHVYVKWVWIGTPG